MTDEEEKADSLRWFRNPPTWPFWPYQTIKKRRGGGEMPHCALLVDFATPGMSEDYDIHFVDAMLWDLDDAAVRKEKLAVAKASPPIDPVKMIEEGWVID
jgi:hypothetical protein